MFKTISMKRKFPLKWLRYCGMTSLVAVMVLTAGAQTATDSLPATVTLQEAIQFAIKNQPNIENALLNEAATEKSIRSKLADWFPQLNFNYTLQHSFEVQPAFFNGQVMRLGVENTSTVAFTARQNIFNRDALLASNTASVVRQYARETTRSSKIEVAANVSKAFYDLLATTQQVKVTEGDIIRLERSLKDATSQYNAGLTDKTDYKRATIALNNSKALLAARQEAVKAKTEILKFFMGYPAEQDFNVQYDSVALEKEILLDTTLALNYENRIEYQMLISQRQLQEATVKYNKWSFIPDIYANGAYNFNYLNNDFGKLYDRSFNNSFAALTVAIPIFQGGKRKYDIDYSKIQLATIDNNLRNLRNNINTEYSQAIAGYKSNLANYLALKENLQLAQEVYDVINLQYRSGVKTYLEVINAETELRSARINYYNALYQVLASKVDVQKALGTIVY